MINSYLTGQIKSNFPYKPTEEQEKAIVLLSDFMFSKVRDSLFVIRGYAGTGKTSLVSALVRTLTQLEQKTVLLAPTGKAAKVFTAYSGHAAYTIHKKIYRQKSLLGSSSQFALNDNLTKNTLYIVDEASMISNDAYESAFGTGCLLDDLIHFVYSGDNCRLLLMGDTAQLPPVGSDQSPALVTDVLKGYGMEVTEIDLTQVVRQGRQSGILWNATRLRQLIQTGNCYSLPKIKVSGFADVRIVEGSALVETLEDCYARDGMEETIVVCRSNKRAIIYNKGIRNQILWREDELEGGDLLMVAKNNYFWTQQDKELDFIANGETAVVGRVHNERELYGFRFADATLSFPDLGDYELDATLLLDTLHSEAPALTRAEHEQLYNAVMQDYEDIALPKDKIAKLKTNTYYNALQVKYAYAITCHKAQGGQWKHVFIDQGYMRDEFLTPDYFRWLYTAFTRATGTLYLVNYPQQEME